MEWQERDKSLSISGGNNAMSTPRAYKEYPTQSKKRSKHVWVVEIAFIAISLLTYLLDIVTDILVGVDYLQSGEIEWGALTFVLVLLPSIIIQVISACWYAADSKARGPTCWMTHIFQMQPLERYLSVLVTGAAAQASGKDEDVVAYHYQMNDVCMLRLFEAFLESAPQLTLQLYVICCTNSATWLTGTCAMMSMLAVGWAVASYSHALRQAYREHYSAVWPGLILQTFWQMAMAAARVLSLVAFASIFKAWVFLVIGVHWMAMTTWVMLQNTDFCPSTIQERFFNAIVGIIYCFNFFNLKEGRSRYRMAAFYVVMCVENAALVLAWYFYRDPDAWFNNAILLTVPIGFLLGLVCMLLYYRFCHPSGPIYLRAPTTEEQCYASAQNPAMVRSPIELPRRAAMLKQSSSRLLPITFKEVCSPSQLSPIQPSPSHPRVYTDSSFQMNDSSAYQHYSVDASACLAQQTTMLRNFEGITLSDSDDSDSMESSLGTPSSSSSSSSCSQSESPVVSPGPGSPIRPPSCSLYSPLPLQSHHSHRLRYIDGNLHARDNISKYPTSPVNCYNPPNLSIQFIDATDTETVEDSDGDILDMSDIHFSYLQQTKPRSASS